MENKWVKIIIFQSEGAIDKNLDIQYMYVYEYIHMYVYKYIQALYKKVYCAIFILESMYVHSNGVNNWLISLYSDIYQKTDA